jgi:site-specific DNA-methyltransferase (adenine-specific)
MGKSWDSTGIAYSVKMWDEALRVLKPGGHLLAFSGSRTYHRMAVAIEDAGFEIRDQIMWVYGSGFPKSMDVSKAIDKQAGVEREVVGQTMHARKGVAEAEDRSTVAAGAYGEARLGDVTVPATDKAKQWAGWGTALKPAHEPIVLARKPLIGTVATNVIIHGTGALNIDGSRIGTDEVITNHSRSADSAISKGKYGDSVKQETHQTEGQALGRWPANFIHDGSDEVVELFPDTNGRIGNTQYGSGTNTIYGTFNTDPNPVGSNGVADSGSAARFFYCAKASKKDRNEGLDDFVEKPAGSLNMRTDEHSIVNKMNTKPAKNFHPTVKPTELMRYLVRMITPPNGVVLDPFMGSGSTGKAAVLERFSFIGIDQSADYIEIATARIKHAQEQIEGQLL